MPGHVFIVPGDIRNIACDAWLIPCSVKASPNNSFLPAYVASNAKEPYSWPKPPEADAWWQYGRRMYRVDGWPVGKPQPWLVNVVRGYPAEQTAEDFYATSVQEALDAVLAQVPSAKVVPKRGVPLVAVPFLGANRGMPYGVRGKLLRDLLTLIYAALDKTTHFVDVVLVLPNAGHYAAAQNERKKPNRGYPCGVTVVKIITVAVSRPPRQAFSPVRR